MLLFRALRHGCQNRKMWPNGRSWTRSRRLKGLDANNFSRKSMRIMWQATLSCLQHPSPTRIPAVSFRCFASRTFSTFHPCLAKKRSMPPKKAAAKEAKSVLGRPGNNLKIGIVGLFPLHTDTSCSSYIVFSQVCQMSANLRSSTASPRPVCSEPCWKFFIPNIACADLGKSANYPYATINPEVRLLARVSMLSLIGAIH